MLWLNNYSHVGSLWQLNGQEQVESDRLENVAFHQTLTTVSFKTCLLLLTNEIGSLFFLSCHRPAGAAAGPNIPPTILASFLFPGSVLAGDISFPYKPLDSLAGWPFGFSLSIYFLFIYIFIYREIDRYIFSRTEPTTVYFLAQLILGAIVMV